MIRSIPARADDPLDKRMVTEDREVTGDGDDGVFPAERSVLGV